MLLCLLCLLQLHVDLQHEALDLGVYFTMCATLHGILTCLIILLEVRHLFCICALCIDALCGGLSVSIFCQYIVSTGFSPKNLFPVSPKQLPELCTKLKTFWARRIKLT